MSPLNRQIDDLLYKNRVNVPMVRAEKSRVFSEFQRETMEGLQKQILQVAKPEMVDRVLLVSKMNAAEQLLLPGFDSISLYVSIAVYLQWAGNVGGQSVMDRMGIDGIFGLTNPDLVRHFEDRSNLLIQGIDEYTATWIANKIKYGAENGLNVNEIVRMLENESLDISSVRAKRIAVNELAYGMGIVQVEAAKKYGVKEKKWVTSRDELVCPICSPLDGTVIGIDNSFEYVVGSKGVSTSIAPPAHVNCRCFLLEVMPSILDLDNPWAGQ